MVAALPGLWGEVCTYYSASLAKSTQGQYDSHVKSFFTFCIAADLDLVRPAESTVMLYVALCVRSVVPATAVQYLKGLKKHYKRRGYDEFADPQAWPKLYAMQKGVARVKKVGVSKKCAITPEMLLTYRGTLDRNSPTGAAMWACVLITFFGYFRKSNTTSESASPYTVGKCIRVSDVEVVQFKHALKIVVRESKTRQTGKSTIIWVAGFLGSPLDPVAAWVHHRTINKVEPVCHAFSFLVSRQVKALHHTMLVGAAKAMAAAVGLPADSVAGHSFRRGGATLAFQCGVPDVLIQRQGDWASLCYREYITISVDQSLLATRSMLQRLDDPVRGASVWGSAWRAADAPAGHVSASLCNELDG